ncbi:unnamed protein product [Prorocentrum cordatum]|uniref:Uncharacterized protein n=1 Tax=Prorocentrum cordatum TaxID=2364126 RepID=A0ABN9UR76_9DINO|nr:unnamed protein product [Polarella glacialis]
MRQGQEYTAWGFSLELCRVLFDALARSAPSLAAEIDSLYAGRVAHYVRSREPCADGSLPESRREEKFLDLQVPIHDCGTLEEALRRLVQPEPLDGDNRWHCEELGRKVDALKGVDVVALPGLLCLQLLRPVPPLPC